MARRRHHRMTPYAHRQVRQSISWVMCLMVVCGVLSDTSSRALAQNGWTTALEAGTEVPLSLGGRLLIESPGGLRVGFGMGTLPESYVDVINNVVVGFGGYDDDVAELIRVSLDRAFVMRLDLGWKLIAGQGLYAQLGYRQVRVGGIVDGALMADIVGDPPPDPTLAYSYDIRSQLHMFDAELGWEFALPGDLCARAGLGFAMTFNANSDVEALQTFDEFLGKIETFLDQTYTRYGVTPTVTFGVGYKLR